MYHDEICFSAKKVDKYDTWSSNKIHDKRSECFYGVQERSALRVGHNIHNYGKLYGKHTLEQVLYKNGII